MITHTKQITRSLTLAALLLFFLFPARPASADIAPPPPPMAGSIQPQVEETQVRMLAETVLIDVAATTGAQAPSAKVSAAFTMRNLSTAEEKMEVRFPLNLLFPSYQGDFNECVYPQGGYPEISSFTAQVDGKPARVTTTYKRLLDPFNQNPRDVACWANFSATFPAQQDVTIEVSYRAEGYLAWNVSGLVQFPYVLVTGGGWAGTIGTADITLRAPYELTAQTLMEYWPENAILADRELRWHFEELEPDFNISATLVNPSVWARVLKERQNVEKNPQDGEAWGRLGKAYKDSIMMPRGYRWDAGAAEIYLLSKEAYEKSVTLLPKDADWHYGYAELLSWNASFSSFGAPQDVRDDLVKALDQLRLALEINPRHARARTALEDLSSWYSFTGPIVDLSGNVPIYLALTTTPTAAPTQIPPPTITPPPSPTVPATQTLPPPPPPTATATITAAVKASSTLAQVVQETVPPTSVPKGTSSSGRGLCGAGLLPAAGLVALRFRKKKASN